MKNNNIISTICFALMAMTSHNVMAVNCTGTPMTQQQIIDTLSDKSIFATNPDTGEEWKEDHCSNGNLYKVGDPAKPIVDPRALKGSWGTLNTGVVEYTYFGQNPLTFNFKMSDNNGTIMFCDMSFIPQQVGVIQSTAGLTGACDE